MVSLPRPALASPKSQKKIIYRLIARANCPYTESVEDEDEVLVALSEELGSFIEYVGGPQWGHVLLSPLENLAAIEEPVVRDKVRASLTALACLPSPGSRVRNEARCR